MYGRAEALADMGGYVDDGCTEITDKAEILKRTVESIHEDAEDREDHGDCDDVSDAETTIRHFLDEARYALERAIQEAETLHR